MFSRNLQHYSDHKASGHKTVNLMRYKNTYIAALIQKLCIKYQTAGQQFPPHLLMAPILVHIRYCKHLDPREFSLNLCVQDLQARYDTQMA